MKSTLAIAALVSLVAAAPAPAAELEARASCPGYNCYVNLSVTPGYGYLGQCDAAGNVVEIARCNCQVINGQPYCV